MLFATVLENPQVAAAAIAAIVAALAGVVVAFLSRQTARRVADLQAALQRELEARKDALERERTAAQFVRDRFARHLDGLLERLTESAALAHSAGKKSWIDSRAYQTDDRRFDLEMYGLRSHLSFLRALDTVSQEGYTKCIELWHDVMFEWDWLVDHALRMDDDYLKRYPNAGRVDPETYKGRYEELKKATKGLEAGLVALAASAKLQE